MRDSSIYPLVYPLATPSWIPLIRKLNERVIRHLFAKSTPDEDGYIRKVYSYNIVVSRACAATHKK